METERANQGWPTTAAEARQLGITYYYTGKPCAKCGRVGLRRARNRDCHLCAQDWSRVHAKKMWVEGRPARQAKWEEDRPAREAAKEAAAAERRRISEETRPQRAAARKVTQQQREAEQRRAWIEEHEEDTDGWYEELAVPSREAYWRDPETQRARRRERTQRGVSGHRMIVLRTPPWLTEEEQGAMDEHYAECRRLNVEVPRRYEVDHIAPVDANPFVSGLHVPWNLQLLKRRANKRKDRRPETLTLEQASEWVRRGMAVWREDVSATGEIDWSRYPRPEG